MTDITERLRQVCETGCDPDLPYEAADEIDRLRARIAELEATRGGCDGTFSDQDEFLLSQGNAAMATCTCSEIQALHGHHFGCPAKDGA